MIKAIQRTLYPLHVMATAEEGELCPRCGGVVGKARAGLSPGGEAGGRAGFGV